jgi:hypothetical protein
MAVRVRCAHALQLRCKGSNTTDAGVRIFVLPGHITGRFLFSWLLVLLAGYPPGPGINCALVLGATGTPTGFLIHGFLGRLDLGSLVNVKIMQFSIKWELAGSYLCPARQGRSNEPKSAICLCFLQHSPLSPGGHHERAVNSRGPLPALGIVLCGQGAKSNPIPKSVGEWPLYIS